MKVKFDIKLKACYNTFVIVAKTLMIIRGGFKMKISFKIRYNGKIKLALLSSLFPIALFFLLLIFHIPKNLFLFFIILLIAIGYDIFSLLKLQVYHKLFMSYLDISCELAEKICAQTENTRSKASIILHLNDINRKLNFYQSALSKSSFQLLLKQKNACYDYLKLLEQKNEST